MKIGYVEGLGNIWEIRTNGDKLISIKMVENALTGDEDAYLELCKSQLQEYFNGSRKEFSLDYILQGTDFQQQVWLSLQDIPFGETTTYLEIAKKIGRPRAVRAVGQAVGANPLAIILPCHRVIGTSGKLVGFAYGIPLKERLLNFEQENRLIKDTRSR